MIVEEVAQPRDSLAARVAAQELADERLAASRHLGQHTLLQIVRKAVIDRPLPERRATGDAARRAHRITRPEIVARGVERPAIVTTRRSYGPWSSTDSNLRPTSLRNR